jgi:hypothetical protein
LDQERGDGGRALLTIHVSRPKGALSHLTSKGGLTARNRSAKVLESLDPALMERRVMTSKNGSCDNAA